MRTLNYISCQIKDVLKSTGEDESAKLKTATQNIEAFDIILKLSRDVTTATEVSEIDSTP